MARTAAQQAKYEKYRKRQTPWLNKYRRPIRIRSMAAGKTLSKQTGFPNKMRVKFAWSNIATLTLTTGGVGGIEVNANDVYIPFTGLGSNQPLYYDQLKAIYTYYNVLGCKIDITACLLDGQTPVSVVVTPTSVSGGYSSIISALERQYSKQYTVTPFMPKRIIRYMSSATIFGIPKDKVLDGDYGAAFDASPGNAWYWALTAQPVDGSSTVNVRYTVRLVFYTALKDLKDIAVS